ncbi:Mycophenolic acid acyl-glucuronide esterase, mitochondrial [Altererythrobacter insulae]|nr:Mycophenolic acid acyl-glucuronide esterase, mitochondrial [Altererythrobacter insulae]
MSDVQFHEASDGRRIAYRFTQGQGPTLVFLPGYMSDMDGGKATSIFAKAQDEGRACLLLDYSGCGQSSGNFADGTLSGWRDEVLSVINAITQGSVVVIGSSMGGWLMLMVGLALDERLSGLVGIAAAPDFTEWGRNDADKAKLSAGETVFDDNPYGPDPTPMHPGFFKDGQNQLMLKAPINISAPVRLLHGQNDADVPWQISMKLAEQLRSDDIQIALVKDGDHRLSREQDIALLHRQVWSLLD